jgi:hypothetical protein
VLNSSASTKRCHSDYPALLVPSNLLRSRGREDSFVDE